MRLINKVSYSCAKGLAEALKEDHKKRHIYYFSLQILIGDLTKTIILFAASLILGVFMPTLFIAISFVSLRMIAGGYHMDSQSKCLYATLGLFITASLIVGYTYQFWSFKYIMLLISVIFVTGVYVLGKYAPKDTPNKPLNDIDKIKKLKAMSLVHFSILLIISVVLVFMDFNLAAISLSFGILLELFVISPVGHKFFDLIK